MAAFVVLGAGSLSAHTRAHCGNRGEGGEMKDCTVTLGLLLPPPALDSKVSQRQARKATLSLKSVKIMPPVNPTLGKDTAQPKLFLSHELICCRMSH